jgi:hypothetical protein
MVNLVADLLMPTAKARSNRMTSTLGLVRNRLRTKFIYREVVDGQAVYLPEIKTEVEKLFPDHQRQINRTLVNFSMVDWCIIISPGKPGGGGIMYSLKKIVLMPGPEALMRETLYHEIFHYLNIKCFLGWTEEDIEAMGITFGQLMCRFP